MELVLRLVLQNSRTENPSRSLTHRKNNQPALAERDRRAGCQMALLKLGDTGSRTMRARHGLPIKSVTLGRIDDIVASQMRIEESANFIAETREVLHTKRIVADVRR